MALFPDDFPFNRRSDDAPVVEATPLEPANAFHDDFPFGSREADAPAPAAADELPAEAGAEVAAEAPAPRPAFVPETSIFPAGFPFVEPQPQPEVVSIVEATPEPAAELTAEEIDALAPFADGPAAAATAPAAMRAPVRRPVVQLPFKDRRRSPRQRMNAKATLRVDTIGGNPLHVEIDNLSLLGVRFLADRELLINDKANLRLEVGPLKWSSRLRVINCLRNDDASYTIGCEFVGNELARGRAAA